MKLKEQEEHREWILDALNQLDGFVARDADFRGDKVYERRAIQYQHQFVADGKYRVVFLGTFNVGKSTAINAFLGGGYLPMDVEECTSRLTFIQRADVLHLAIKLAQAAEPGEIHALERLFQAIPATLTASEDRLNLSVAFETGAPSAMRQSLEPLVTVTADEEYPILAPLRDKIEEISLCLPSTVLTEDIVFVDTPGVHSVSETRAEITYDIIERSHLVICFVDSSFAGNIHDLNFIKRIIKWRGRHVFFVLNKADKLDSDEIDIRGARGPARTLLEAFGRHEIPEDCELFFLSGYRALRAQQLSMGQITLDDVLDDNKVSIPTSVRDRLDESKTPSEDLAAYLLGQSRFPHLKDRLHDYLLHENKAGTVLGTAAQFAWGRSDDFAAPLDNELALARDPAKFDELRAHKAALDERLDAIKASSEVVLARFRARSTGGTHLGETFAGYEQRFREAMSEARIREAIVQPVVAWLREGTNLKDARTSKFRTLSAQVEHQVDEFVSGILAEVNAYVDTVEDEAQSAIVEQLGQIRSLRALMAQPGKLEVSDFDASMTRSYVAFGAGGLAFGVAAGATVGSVVPVLGTAIGAGIGGLIGVVGGLVARLAWSEERWIKKLEPVIHDNALGMLVRGGKDRNGNEATPVITTVATYLNRRAGSFEDAVRGEVDNAILGVQVQVDDLLAREAEIRREREAIVARLEPKVTLLRELRERAAAVVAACETRETVRV
jgi:hypothetical protein